MGNKTYEQMKIDFKELYFKQIRPSLREYEDVRKKVAPQNFVAYIALFSFSLSILLTGLVHSISNLINVFWVLILMCVCSVLLLSFLTRNNPLDSEGRRPIKFDLEKDLKRKWMKSFLSIFSDDASWQDGLPCNYFEKVSEYRKLNIFNPFLCVVFDDRINLTYKNMYIKLWDTNTSIFNLYSLFNIFPIFFLLGFVSPIVYMFFWVLHLSFPLTCTLLLILASPFFILLVRKGIQYAPFKGVVVELKLSKWLLGHTFFLNKSIASSKISIDAKKYESVNLESTDFMDKYQVYSTDQIEARCLLSPAMIDRINNLKLAFRSNYIRGSFKDDKLILAIDTGKDMFAMGNDFKVSNYRTFKNLFKEIISILQIVDQLKIDNEE